jgi:quercetin dioxygenase-like cupin family protein
VIERLSHESGRGSTPKGMLMTPAPAETVHLLGNLITFRATSAMTGGAFSIAEARTAPGQGSPPHLQRRDVEAFLVLEGSYEFTVGGETRVEGPGGFVLVPADVPHWFRNPTDADSRMLIINLPGGLHEAFFREAGDPVADATTFPPMGAPDVPRMMGVAAGYGIEFLPPG